MSRENAFRYAIIQENGLPNFGAALYCKCDQARHTQLCSLFHIDSLECMAKSHPIGNATIMPSVILQTRNKHCLNALNPA